MTEEEPLGKVGENQVGQRWEQGQEGGRALARFGCAKQEGFSECGTGLGGQRSGNEAKGKGSEIPNWGVFLVGKEELLQV